MTIARIDTICIYQVSVKFASHSGHTNLMSKTNCPVKFPCFLDYYGNREKNSLKASVCVCVRGVVLQSLSIGKAHCAPGVMTLTWQTMTLLKAVRPSQLHGSLQIPMFWTREEKWYVVSSRWRQRILMCIQ